ncbi:BLUF domain-containing protein [Planctomicrobium sp. SH661]|uniref:BLUF domain-containing protein n=1 Tax=Planctomicrobium sp. SH661 TaxID=3448124 RepID=UPI003F5B1330
MIHLIYTSTARAPLSGVELSRLLLKSRVSNDIAGVTGILLHRGDSFMHLLEGEEEAVEETFARIAADPRHCGVQVLLKGPTEERMFPTWSLGFIRFENSRVEEPVGLQEFFEKKGRPTAQLGQTAIQLLSCFRFGHWRRHVERGQSPVVAR